MEISTVIVFYLSILLDCLIMNKIYEKYSEHKLIYNKKTIITIILISILYFLNNLFVYILLKFIISAILFATMYKVIFKDDIKTTIYYSLILSISLYVLDIILSLTIPVWFKNIEMFNQSIIFKIGYSLLVILILYLIMTNKTIVKFFKQIKETSKSYKIFYIIGIIALIICTVWGFFSYKSTANKPLHIILSITELTILIFIISLLKNKFEKNILMIKEEQLKQNLNLYTKIASEYRELKHNLMNDFLAIKTKLNKKDQSFINDIINKYKSNYEWVNDITDIPEGLQGLVFLKKHQAELKHITFNLEYNVNKNIEKQFEINKNFRLYETLGILFDNAIEAAHDSKEKMINVVFSYEKVLKISIYNTFINDIDVDKIGTKDYSTKKRGSGVGLYYINKQKNKFKVKQHIQNNIFITEIIFNTKEKK